jgi:hypothetical protein
MDDFEGFKQHCVLQWNLSWKEESVDSANVIIVLLKETATATPTISNHHPDQSTPINMEERLHHQQKEYDSQKAQKMVSIFQQWSISSVYCL